MARPCAPETRDVGECRCDRCVQPAGAHPDSGSVRMAGLVRVERGRVDVPRCAAPSASAHGRGVVGCVGFVVAVGAWVALSGRPPGLVFTFTIGHIITFFFWFALVSWSGIATSAIERSLKAEEQARLERELQVSINSAMAVKLADVSVRVRGTLEALRDEEVTPEIAMEARLLEAELRDEIRAPYFTGTEVVAAARRARSRGVEVVLFDDRGDATRGGGTEYEERLRARIVERAVAALDEAGAGRVVVRACPAGRPWAATILTDAGLAVVEAKEGAVEVGEAGD